MTLCAVCVCAVCSVCVCVCMLCVCVLCVCCVYVLCVYRQHKQFAPEPVLSRTSWPKPNKNLHPFGPSWGRAHVLWDRPPLSFGEQTAKISFVHFAWRTNGKNIVCSFRMAAWHSPLKFFPLVTAPIALGCGGEWRSKGVPLGVGKNPVVGALEERRHTEDRWLPLHQCLGCLVWAP